MALVDVKMPAGGGPRAAREIMRVSPDTRVIALSAFEDRPTVLEMLRAGAVGYLVKGTAGEEILGSIQKVMAGGASLSSEVIAGIVHELTAAAPTRGERVASERDARRGEIERFVAGEGLSMVFQPIVELATRSTVGRRGAGPVPLARRCDRRTNGSPRRSQLALGVQLELTTIAQALRQLPTGCPRAPTWR